MIQTTPFHDRVEAANATRLWSHWAGHLVAEQYDFSEKLEYFAVRNGVGVFDTSPLYKYRISGSDVERYLAAMLARNPASCAVGHAQYQIWCDDGGHVLEDGVLFRLAETEYLLTTARPNLAFFGDFVGRDRVVIEECSRSMGALAIQGPRSRAVLASLAPVVHDLRYFELAHTAFGNVPVMVSRTGFTGDLGYEVWVDAEGALEVWDRIFAAGQPHGIVPFGQVALLMARIEAGLLLIGVDFESSKRALNDSHRATPFELGLGWMLRDLDGDRHFVGRNALRRLRSERAARWNTVGVAVDPIAHAEAFEHAGLLPPKNHLPVHQESMVYDENGERAGFVTSSMYSPMLQRHIGIARIRPDLAAPGTPVRLEFTIDHRYDLIGAEVTRLPMFDPERKVGP